MFKTAVILLAFVMCACNQIASLPVQTSPAPLLSSKSLNIDTILSSDRLLNSYIRCLMDEGPCTQSGKNLKQLLPDAIQTDCSKCNRMQKHNSRKVITFFRMRRPQDWKRLTDKYDPLGLSANGLGLL